GGEATYHGPGQLVGYPSLQLPDRLEVKRLVTDLDELLLRTCADFGPDATREAPERGVWAGGEKRASIARAVRRCVAMRGSVVRDFEQRRLRIDVDDDDLLRLLHAGEMLDGTADADGQVKLRPDRHPRLADLQHLRYPTAVDGLARGRDRAAEQVRELLEHREVLRVP